MPKRKISEKRGVHGSSDDRSVVSLFSGAMGMDIGLEQAGLNIKVVQDIDVICLKTALANGHKFLRGDIRQIRPETLLEVAGLKAGDPFLVCGGPPCQPFSTAGKRLGIDDPQGNLFVQFVRMIDHIRPRFFIMENVKGLMSSGVGNSAGSGKGGKDGEPGALEAVQEEIARLGYRTVSGILDAVNYGTPQFRERFVIIGSRDNEDVFLPIPSHFQTHQDPAHRWMTLREAIGDLEDNPGMCASFTGERADYLKLVPEGGNWKKLPEEMKKKAMGGAFASGGGKVGFYRRLSYSQPSPTLVTSPVQKASMLCHPKKLRPLSVTEYSRIQQFPESWVFAGKMLSQYRQIGNAIPVGLGKALGQVLVSVANGQATVKTSRLRTTTVFRKLREAMELTDNMR